MQGCDLRLELIVPHDPANVLAQLQSLYADLIGDPAFFPSRPDIKNVTTSVAIGVHDNLNQLGSDTPSEVDEAREDLCNSIEATRPLDNVMELVNPVAIAGWGSPEATEAWMSQRRGASTEDFSSECKARLSDIDGCATREILCQSQTIRPHTTPPEQRLLARLIDALNESRDLLKTDRIESANIGS